MILHTLRREAGPVEDLRGLIGIELSKSSVGMAKVKVGDVGEVGGAGGAGEPIHVLDSGRRSTYSYICVRNSNGKERKVIGMVNMLNRD